MDFHQDKHRKISIALMIGGIIMLVFLALIGMSGFRFLANTLIDSRNSNLISPPKIVPFDLQEAEGLNK